MTCALSKSGKKAYFERCSINYFRKFVIFFFTLNHFALITNMTFSYTIYKMRVIHHLMISLETMSYSQII